MKFYIASIILNIGILFIPAFVLSQNTGKDTNETITVNLDNFVSENLSEESSDKNKQKAHKEEVITSQKPEIKEFNANKPEIKQNNVPINKIQNNHTDNKTTENTRNENAVINNNNSSHQNNSVSQSSGESSGSKGKEARSTGVSENTESAKKGNTTGHSRDNGNVCREGIDFTVVYNPDLQYPVAAERLGTKNTVVVNVRLNFNSNGNVSVIGVSGGNGIFQSEAKKSASRIKVRIKNPETLKCTITKPFRFNPR